MKVQHIRSLGVTLVAAMIWAAALTSASAQERSQGTAVVYPVVFTNGTDTSRKTAVDAVREVLQKAGYTLISDRVAADTWRRMRLPRPTAEEPPTMSELVRFGQEVNAQYVVSPTFNYHSRSIWVDLGPRTVSTVTMDVTIADVTDNKIVYSRDEVTGRSDEKFDAAKAGADLLLTPLVTVVSGGPKTPHEQRAAQIAVSKALRGWVRRDDDGDHRRDGDRHQDQDHPKDDHAPKP